METTKTVQMLPVAELKAHPQNPRRDLGDLTELADSIRENGVLQNLTVVPWLGEVTGQPTGDYKVIIGHRRLAAAKQAGLTEVPCVVTMMTPAEQVKTMLMENMQRSDLTPLEQADGFQMMLDLGVTLDEVVQESGFSESTVRRRLKLRELDRQTLEDKLTQGATLMDLIKLEQLDDEKVRNKVLESAGTNNFDYELKKALDAQKRKKNKPLWEELLSGFAQKIAKGEENSKWEYFQYYSLEKDPDEFKVPDDTDTVTYGYIMEATSFSLRKLKPDASEIEEHNAEEARQKALIQEVEKTLTDSSLIAYKLRLDFIQSTNLRKKHIPDAINYLLFMLGNDGRISDGVLAQHLDVPTGQGWSKDREARTEGFANLLKKDPDKALLVMVCALAGDHSGNDYVQTFWNSHRYPLFEANPRLDRLYDFLELLGYQISDEEQLLMSGEHPAFQPGKEQQANEPDEEDDEDDEEE